MTPAEVIDVLTKCAAYDQRTVGEGDVLAWYEILDRTDVADAFAAVRLHYAESRDRAMPADIRKLAIGIRDARQARDRQTAGRLAIEAGTTDRSDDVTALVRAVAAALPQPDAHTRARDRARKERGRPTPLPPKAKRPTKPVDFPPPSSDDIAALATRYLIDGHSPADVSQRLGVSRRWCERTSIRMEDSA